MPTSRPRQPASIVRRGSRPRNANAAAAPMPQSRKMTSPPQIRFGDPVAWAARVGPSDRYRPPSAQPVTMAGTAAAKVGRADRGTTTRGRSEASTPGRREPGFGHEHHRDDVRGKDSHQHPPDQVGRRRGELDQHAGDQRAQRQPQAGEDAGHQRRPLATGRLQVEQGGTDRAGGQSAGDALQGPGQVEVPGTAGGQEDAARSHAEDQRRDDDRAPAQVVRDRSQEQQRDQQDQDVHGENSGQRGGREMKPGLVHLVQRRRRGRGEEHQQEHSGQDPECGRPGQRHTSRLHG